MKYFSYFKNNNIVNLSNSILKRFGVNPFHETLQEIDELLENRCKIALFLFDGLGKSISEKNLSEDSYLRKNLFTTISSTFPPTTVAATNGFRSGLYPAENGWLGWSLLDTKNNVTLEYFTHRNYATKELVNDFDYSQFNFKSIFDYIREKNDDYVIFENFPFGISNSPNTGFKNIDEMMEIASNVFKNNEKALVYSYFLDPDSTLHRSGTTHPKVKSICEEINRKVEEFAKNNPDTLVLVFADHSHLDVKPLFWDEQNELRECVTSIYAIESRAANFVVKKGYEKTFLSIYENKLKDHYVLINKEEAIKQELFGPSSSIKWLEKLLGDYILIATGEYSFENFKDDPMLSTHGGGTEKENLINLYIMNK